MDTDYWRVEAYLIGNLKLLSLPHILRFGDCCLEPRERLII
jgi:hypothetical protein